LVYHPATVGDLTTLVWSDGCEILKLVRAEGRFAPASRRGGRGIVELKLFPRKLGRPLSVFRQEPISRSRQSHPTRTQRAPRPLSRRETGERGAPAPAVLMLQESAASSGAGLVESLDNTALPSVTLDRVDADAVLRTLLRKISVHRQRWGYRRAHVRLAQLGTRRTAGACSGCGARKALCRSASPQTLAAGRVDRPSPRLRAERPDHVGAIGLQLDQAPTGAS
jgi:hypothetical protein